MSWSLLTRIYIHQILQYKETLPGFKVANSGFGEDVRTFLRHLEITVTHGSELWGVCDHMKRYLKVLRAEPGNHPRYKIL